MLKHLIRWLDRHNDLPLVSVPSAAVTDDDTAAWGDFRYMRELVDELLHVVSVTHGSCPQLEEILERSTLVEWDEYHAALMIWPDPAGELLRQWRLDDEDVAA